MKIIVYNVQTNKQPFLFQDFFEFQYFEKKKVKTDLTSISIKLRKQ